MPVPRRVVTQRTAGDVWFRSISTAAGIGVFVILFLIGLFLAIKAWPAFSYMGLRFFTTPAWVPQPQHGHPAEIGIAVAAVGTDPDRCRRTRAGGPDLHCISAVHQ